MDIPQLRKTIQKKRESGQTYRRIASKLGINAALVQYIETHEDYKPSKQVAKIFNLDPDQNLICTRKRRERLNEIAKSWGYTSWSNYETEMIRTYSMK